MEKTNLIVDEGEMKLAQKCQNLTRKLEQKMARV